MQMLTIEPGKEPESTHRIAAKTRQFSAVKLAHVCAGMLWSASGTADGPIRPVWMALAGGETELRPFVANMRKGRPAILHDPHRSSYSRGKPTRFELLRSAGYTYTTRRIVLPDDSNGEIVIASLDDLLGIDPGLIAPEGIRFLALPPRWWVDQERDTLRMDRAMGSEIVQHMHRLTPHLYTIGIDARLLTPDALLALVPIAVYIRSYVDRRTRRPMFMTPAFALQLYFAGLASGVFSLASSPASRAKYKDNPSDLWHFARHTWAASFIEEETAAVGLLPGVAGYASHAAVDQLLATEAARYVAIQERARMAA